MDKNNALMESLKSELKWLGTQSLRLSTSTQSEKDQ